MVDVSDPTRPTEIGFVYPMNYAFEVTVAGHYTYIAAWALVCQELFLDFHGQ